MKKHTANWLFTGVIVVLGITILCIPAIRKPDNTTEQTQDTTTIDTQVVAPGNVVAELTDTIRTDTIHEEPFAWKPDTIPYLFGKPSARKIKEYKQFFDKIHREKSQWWGENFNNLPIEQWYVINGLYSLWNDDKLKKQLKNTELILWRLNQYAPMQLSPGETAMDRYNKLQTQIDSALNYDPDAGGNAGLMEYYSVQNILDDVSETILTQDLYAVCRSDTLKNLLRQEQSAFKAYRKSEKNLGDHFFDQDARSASWMISWGILGECDRLNRDSKMVLFARLTHSTDTTVSYPYKVITKSSISAEYKKTEYYLCYTELTLPPYGLTDTMAYRQRIHSLLNRDKAAWFRWMEARAAVSASLTGNIKSDYDNTTNRMKRTKLIQLKNRFESYGVRSNSVFECLLYPDCTDKELQETDFEKRWNKHLESLDKHHS